MQKCRMMHQHNNPYSIKELPWTCIANVLNFWVMHKKEKSREFSAFYLEDKTKTSLLVLRERLRISK